MATAVLQPTEFLIEVDALLNGELIAIRLEEDVFALACVGPDGVTNIGFVNEACTSLTDRCTLTEELSAADRDTVARIARKEIKGEKTDDRILKAVKNALTSLFQALYSRRSLWRNEISIDHQS